jgi:uncharacterized protein YodC (DUF2158 family)
MFKAHQIIQPLALGTRRSAAGLVALTPTKMKENRMPFIPGDVVRLKSGGVAMTVAKATDIGVECDWCEGKKLRSKTFHPDQLTTTDPAPTIKVNFVKSDDGRPASEPSA